MKNPVALLLLPLGLFAAPAVAEKACAEPAVAFSNVRVFDGHSVIPQATVVIRCTTISRVVNGSEVMQLPADTVIIDGTGRTLLPGLIDTHTHTWSVPMLERPLDFGVTVWESPETVW